MRLYYLSFASDTAFLGCVFVEGRELVDAVRAAHRLGINPGGEVLGAPVPEDMMPPTSYRRRLLTEPELEEVDRVVGGSGLVRGVSSDAGLGAENVIDARTAAALRPN
jgi:hypothetical protein